ncbi:hypothetical protein D3C80_1888870 [compost metagenome]
MMVTPKPSTAMASSDNDSSRLAAKASRAIALVMAESRMSRGMPPTFCRAARNTEDSSEPSPAAPQSQPRVRASPAKMSRANTGSSEA